MFNPFKKPTQEPEKNFRIMQNQITHKFFIQKRTTDYWYARFGNYRLETGKSWKNYPTLNIEIVYFDTPAEAEIQINEFKKIDEQEELRKNPNIIRYV